jgi:protein TonB
LIICCSFFFLTSFAQDKNSFYALDANMNQTVLDSSKYILWIHEKEDKNWQWDYYKTWGPMIKSTSFADHDGTVQKGDFYLYNTNGDIDSTGRYENGKKNGDFYKYHYYEADSTVFIKEYIYENDSLRNTVKAMISLKQIVFHLPGADSIDTPAGDSSWSEFLSKNLIYPERARSKKIEGTVNIFFSITEEGDVKNVYIKKSVEYSLDQEALKIIKDSGKWFPHMKDGIKVRTAKTVAIPFKLDK